jgi:hypothetical protein
LQAVAVSCHLKDNRQIEIYPTLISDIMGRIFISHSSKDKAIAEQLANDLYTKGYWVWLDAWRIKVGQCILHEIEYGLDSVDFVILLLSKHAVESLWVDREWKTAYWDEVNKNSIVILPACIEPCIIPKLLQTKKYATLYESYLRGFSEIVDALEYYELTKLNTDFFHAIYSVRAEITTLPKQIAVKQNKHWDLFEQAVDSLTFAERLRVQKANTEFYLDKWHLSITQLKKELRFLGVYDGELDDNFTDDVVHAIIWFQRIYNLRHIDGIFGPLTYSEMEKVARSKTAW